MATKSSVAVSNDADRKSELLALIADYMLENGLAELSLRPLAEALGTSPRMLIYYFGSKETLVSEALAAARAKERKAIYRWAADISQSDDPLTVVDRMWDWMTAKRTERFMRLFFEVYGLSLTDPTRFPEFIER